MEVGRLGPSDYFGESGSLPLGMQHLIQPWREGCGVDTAHSAAETEDSASVTSNRGPGLAWNHSCPRVGMTLVRDSGVIHYQHSCCRGPEGGLDTSGHTCVILTSWGVGSRGRPGPQTIVPTPGKIA